MTRRFTEDELIARCFAPLVGKEALGLEDDAALLSFEAPEDVVVTTDAIVGGVHFFEKDAPGLIAKKALRVNLSDLAAKGAEPLGFLLTLALPPDWTNEWLMAFAAGLGEDARQYSCPLLGGDTSRTPGPLVVSITALGRAARGRFVSRSGAHPGDRIYVSGTIGDGALGLVLRRDEDFASRLDAAARRHLEDRYLLPRPRVELIETLRAFASAAMDISDGLAGDLAKMMRASRTSAVVELACVPLSPAAREAIAMRPELEDIAFTGGDDYEILCCAPLEAAPRLEEAARKAGVPLTRIGEVVAGAGAPLFLGADGQPKRFENPSFSHF